jgi:subtilisin family serine protease
VSRPSFPTTFAVAVTSVAALVVASAPLATASTSGDTSRFRVVSTPTVDSQFTVAKSVSGRLAKSDPALLRRTDSAPVSVMVKLDLDSVASYSGGVSGLAPTSPLATGKSLDDNARAVRAYTRHADQVLGDAARDIERRLPAAKVGKSFTTAYGGIAVTLPANKAKDLLAVPGVVAVQADTLQHTLTDSTPQFVGATKVWPSLGGSSKAGAGVIVGVLDSGVWPEHPSFADPGIPAPAGGPFDCEFGDGSTPALGATFACNDKLVGAHVFLNTYLSTVGAEPGEYCATEAGPCSARDSEGHGTHTATTAAGSPLAHSPVLGVDRGALSGIAPGASVIAYRVCLAQGCFSSDSVAAVQQAIADGVDVINFSISGGSNAYTDPVELAFLDATAAGISVNASAGNSGPGASTADHGGPWVTTVGASTSNRHFQSTLTLTADNGATYSKVGSTLTSGVGGVPVVRAQDVPGYTGGAVCNDEFAAGSLTGKVVLCQRGVNGRVQKGFNAMKGGASGMVLYNPTRSDTETDNHFLPAIHLEGPNDDLLAFLASHSGVTATWATGQKASVRGNVMAGFSSRGPSSDFIKPDITAPGVQILAGNTPTPTDVAAGPPGELFQAIAGTSMSSPHLAGASALVKAAHPGWTPGQIKSALMTSSTQDVLKEDGVTPADPFDRGAGALRVDTAVAAVVTISETPERFVSSAGSPRDRVDLNLPSIQANPLPGALTTTRTLQNVTGRDQEFKVSATAANGMTIRVSPREFTVRARGSRTITITIDGTAAPDGWSFGQITLRPDDRRAPKVVLPVAARVADSAIPMTHTCTPTTVTRNQAAHCTVTLTNTSAAAADINLSLDAGKSVNVNAVSAPATAGPHGFTWTGTLAPVTAPTITSITPGGSPAGYVPLSAFGVSPVAGMGDETIVNFNVPAFKYGGETYTRLGVVSNGYVVVGGGTAADVNFVPQPIPSETRPNNIVAPQWSDLNPSEGGEIRVGTLTDGVDSWLIVDFQDVVYWGTSVGNSFQTWFQLGDTERTSVANGTVNPAPPGYGLSQGAENRTGTSGATFDGQSNTDWSITTAPPAPGGSVTVTYDASSSKAGTYLLAPKATTPVVKGTISKVVKLTVK